MKLMSLVLAHTTAYERLFGSDPVKLLFFRLRFLLGGTNDSVFVVCRRVDGIELQAFGSRGVHDIVSRARRHHDGGAISDRVFAAVNDAFALSSFKTKELVRPPEGKSRTGEPEDFLNLAVSQ